MSRVLIYVKPDPNTWRPDFAFEGARRSAYVAPALEYEDSRPASRHELFDVAEEDIDVALTELTKNFPGREVGVFRLEKAAIRPPADMVIKNVTKDGVLP